MVVCLLFSSSGSSIIVNAKSLADCFSGWSETTNSRKDAYSVWIYYKKSFAKTSGYGATHYVRCYIDSDFKGDSGRVWAAKPYNSLSANSSKVQVGMSENTVVAAIQAKLHTAYAKYGTN